MIISQHSEPFLSTLSLRRATAVVDNIVLMPGFLSTLSLRRATRRHRGNDRRPIHFYPRSPCGERPCITTITICTVLFLSTLSLRRATRRHRGDDRRPINFYPRSPCGERPWTRGSRVTYVEFLSTLSLRRATAVVDNIVLMPGFLSTLSLRRATYTRALIPQ